MCARTEQGGGCILQLIQVLFVTTTNMDVCKGKPNDHTAQVSAVQGTAGDARDARLSSPGFVPTVVLSAPSH